MMVRAIADLVSDLEIGCQSWKKKRGRLSCVFYISNKLLGLSHGWRNAKDSLALTSRRLRPYDVKLKSFNFGSLLTKKIASG